LFVRLELGAAVSAKEKLRLSEDHQRRLAQQYRAKAERLREQAITAPSDISRRTALRAAADYDRTAARLDPAGADV
jgi:hypothetical protein